MAMLSTWSATTRLAVCSLPHTSTLRLKVSQGMVEARSSGSQVSLFDRVDKMNAVCIFLMSGLYTGSGH